MARVHCRCRECRARRVLRMHPDHYEPNRLPKCAKCGKRNYVVDQWMNRRDTRKAACIECGGYWFPHRMGSLFCHFRKDGSPRLIGDQDFRDRRMTDDEIKSYLQRCAETEKAQELETI